jgi:hypothetical protein
VTATLASFLPEIVDQPESSVLRKFQDELVGDKVWAPADLQDWLEDQGLADWEAYNFTDHLIDHLIANDLGYEFGGLTPWCGEGYSLYFEDDL